MFYVLTEMQVTAETKDDETFAKWNEIHVCVVCSY